MQGDWTCRWFCRLSRRLLRKLEGYLVGREREAGALREKIEGSQKDLREVRARLAARRGA